MKALHYLAWASGIAALLIIIIGLISLILEEKIFGIVHVINYFHVASTLLLLAICCLLYKKPG